METDEIIKKALEKSIERYKDMLLKYEERKYDAYAEANDFLPPTIDKFGRLHAPADGYSFGDKVFNKGEFLPEPETELDHFFGTQKGVGVKMSKILIPETSKELFEELSNENENNDYFSAKFSSRSWYNDNLGQNATYVYISGMAAGFFNKEIEGEILRLKNEMKKDHEDSMSTLVDSDNFSIEGEIVKIRTIEDTFRSTNYQTFFKNELGIKLKNGNNIIYGTLPKKLDDATPDKESLEGFLVGKKVKMEAKLVVNRNDPKKGYYKSPKKIQLFNNDEEISLKKKVSKKHSIWNIKN